jgi:hypothetical protein
MSSAATHPEQPTVKNTFIHLPDEEEEDGIDAKAPPMASAPGALLTHLFATVGQSGGRRNYGDMPPMTSVLEVTHGAEEGAEEEEAAEELARADSPKLDLVEKDAPKLDPVEEKVPKPDAVEEVAEELGSLTVSEVPAEAVPPPLAPEEEWSIGSALHAKGRCKPCKKRWLPQGCPNGTSCTRCHLCPRPDEECPHREASQPSKPSQPQQEPARPETLQREDSLRQVQQVEPAYVQMSPTLLKVTRPVFAVKNTFVYVPEDSADGTEGGEGEGEKEAHPSSPPLASAPALMLSAPFVANLVMPSTPLSEMSAAERATELSDPSPEIPEGPGEKADGAPKAVISREEMQALHDRKECRPCAYFYFKVDGCRNSESCEFCHLCNKGEIKRRKRQKVKELKRGGPAAM